MYTRAKAPPLYSTLKPETSSDSPSTKSKGARLVSANIHITHTTNLTTIQRISTFPFTWNSETSWINIDPAKIVIENWTNLKGTS